MKDTRAEAFITRMRQYISEAGSHDWIEVYRQLKAGFDDLAVVGVLVPESVAKDVLRTSSWDVQPTRLSPGCTKYFDGRVEYQVHGDVKGYQPIVLERSFHDIKPEYKEIAEEFRLFHNLYFDAKNDKYVKISDDGAEHDVIRFQEGLILCRALEIKQFLAVKEMRLGLFFDLRQHYTDSVTPSADPPSTVSTERGEDVVYTCVIADNAFGSGSFARMFGKKLITGFDKADSGFWPYNEQEDDQRKYMEFIVGLDQRGKELTLPCDPHGGGDYLTPVCFRADVLNRYYDNPSKYSVEDGYLRCRDLWGVQIDNDNPGYISVFLGDIGRDIPISEHTYWRSFNIVPSGGISHTAFRRSFLAEFADPTRKDLLFKQHFVTLQKSWSGKNGWSLFQPLSPGDEHCFDSLRIPATDEQTEFDTQVMYLTKVLVDSLNEAEIAKHIISAPNQKGIDKVEEYLKSKTVIDYDKHIQFLRDLQSIRSSGAAHRKGKNYEKVAKKLGLETRDRRAVFEELLDGALSFVKAMQALT